MLESKHEQQKYKQTTQAHQASLSKLPCGPSEGTYSPRLRRNPPRCVVFFVSRLTKCFKCDGSRPCNRCSEKHQDCAYAASGDGRSSRLDFRYKVAELQHENWILRHFVTYLQQSNEENHHEVLGRLRNLPPNCVRSNVDALFNLTRQVSSLPDQPHLGGSNALLFRFIIARLY